MTDVKEAYKDLAEWVDVAEHPDKEQFDSLLSDFVRGILFDILDQNNEDQNSPTYIVLNASAQGRDYEQFFTLD